MRKLSPRLAERMNKIVNLKEVMELPRFKQLGVDVEACCSCNSPNMVDLSHLWENPQLIFEQGGIALG